MAMATVVAMALWLYGYWALWFWPLGSDLALGQRPKSKAAAMAMLWLLPWSCPLLWLGGCVRARCTSVANEIVVCLIVLELGS